MSGITETGYEIRTYDQIFADLKAKVIARFAVYNEEPDLSVGSVLGETLSIVALELADAWEDQQAIYASQDPSQASGAALKNAAALCPGIKALEALRTVIPGVLSLNAGVTVPAGSLVHPTGLPTYQFRTMTAVTNSGGSPDDFDVSLESVEYGRYVFVETTLVIDTPISGWTAAVVESAGAYTIMGRNDETDNELRTRRESMIHAAGSATVDAIRADVLAVDTDNIRDVKVLENDTIYYDSVYLINPNSIKVLVWDGSTHLADTQKIAQAIFDSKAGGCPTNGDESDDAVDDVGDSHTIYFSYADEIPIYLWWDNDPNGTTILADNAPANWSDLIDAKLLELVLAQKIGQDVSYSRLIAGVMGAFGYGLPMSESLPSGGWLISFGIFALSLDATPGQLDLSIDEDCIATLDTEDISHDVG